MEVVACENPWILDVYWSEHPVELGFLGYVVEELDSAVSEELSVVALEHEEGLGLLGVLLL